MFVYKYLKDDGSPLTHCHECGHHLAAFGGILIECCHGFSDWKEPSQLDATGLLIDESGHVAMGYHSATLCGKCEESLVDFEHFAV